jgi:DNA-binding response OmpR family regulator
MSATVQAVRAAKRIALIEDDDDLAYTVSYSLKKEGLYEVERYASGLAALDRLVERPPDLILLDLNLPDVDGLALCREIRKHEPTRLVPILMLTARAQERDKLLGFELGADDYVTKPFSIKELLARVAAHLRRVASHETSEDELFEDAHLRIDRPRHAVTADGKEVHLTKKEFDLLWLLVKSRSRVVSRETILTRLWDYSTDVETRTVDVHIRALRRKLGDDAIETVVGVGYRFRERGRGRAE